MVDPKVSIIIPIYKTEKYLLNCLQSVQNQTMPDFEAILVDDCTPDNSMQIAQKFAQTDPRFQIFRHEVNQGLGCARNSGIRLAKGEYLSFLDSDDSLPKDAIEVLCNQAESVEADMVIGNMAWIRENRLSPVKYIDRRIRSWSTNLIKNIRLLSEDVCLIGSVCNRLFKNRLIQENEIWFPEQTYFEDIPYSMETWFYSKYVAYIPNYVYFRTQRNDRENLSLTQIYNEKAFLDRDVIAQHVYDFASQKALLTEYAARLGRCTLLTMLGTTKDMLASIDDNIKIKITAGWFPLHAIRVNNMINQLNKLC